MIKSLSVENYALIDKTEIDFNEGFSVITGETGAGKSILLGALGLVFGERADVGVLRDKERKCIVEVCCVMTAYNLNKFFDDNDIDYEEETYIRREISPKGKSRAFINDTPVNLKVLRQLSLQLIDIHSQHQTQTLLDKYYQLGALDSFAGIENVLKDYKKGFQEYTNLKSEYKRLRELADKEKADFDYFQFQFNQIDEAKLIEGEQEELENELEKLNHAEEIKTSLLNSYRMLDGEEMSVLNSLREVENLLSKISDYLPESTELSDRVNSTYIELQDLSGEFERIGEDIHHDPSRIDIINERLDVIYTLQQKHRVDTVAELINIREELEEKLQNISSYDDKLLEIEEAIKAKEEELKDKAENISQHRSKCIPQIQESMTSLLVSLGIRNAVFIVEQSRLDELTSSGIDEVHYLFSANKSSEPQELSRVASGGEMSRVMLSLKYILSSSRNLPTIIFDEIDTGVSGDIADRMAQIMQEMSQRMQVISITHLPQIAGSGKWHYKVFKYDEGDATHSRIELLTEKSRLEEIAKMLSGSNVTEAAYDNARELLKI
jgi:DNA repair protein RecN (Recombination protein N)